MRDSVPSASYSSVCNVLRQWNIPLIPTYRVYRLYDTLSKLIQTSNAQNFKIKTTNVHGNVSTQKGFLQANTQLQNKQSNKMHTISSFSCSVCFVIVCLPEEDPSGLKHCSDCFDFKFMCVRSLF